MKPATERVFSLLNNSFNTRQESVMEDYIELHMHNYDGVCGNLDRSVGKIGGKKEGNLCEFSSNLYQGLVVFCTSVATAHISCRL